MKGDRLLLLVPCSLALLIMAFLSFSSSHVSAGVIWMELGYLMVVFVLGFVRRRSALRGWPVGTVLASSVLIAITLWLVDWHHVLTLFFPEQELTAYYDAYIPHWFKGFYGEWVRLPKWEHQLRDGLLWSALLSIPIAGYLYFSNPCRASAFLFANAIIPLLVVVSPYTFTFLTALIPEEGIYRIHMAIFHPIILAAGLSFTLSIIRDRAFPLASDAS